jgi:branched-chain amino acid transport system substrate-binding protein
MSRPTSQRSLSGIALLVALALLTSGCGTRQSHLDVVRAASGVAHAPTGETGTEAPVTRSTAGAAPSSAPVSGPVSTYGPQPTASSASTRTAAVAGPATVGGAANHTPVVIGQVGDFSGIVGVAGAPMRAALAVWVQDINAKGGLAGHPVQLVSIDTQGSASKAQAAVRTLVEDKHAVAVVAAYLGLTLSAVTKYMNDKHVPVIGGELAGYAWFQNPMFFPQGTTTSLALYGILQTTAAEHKPKMALFYCTEAAVCSDTRAQMRAYAPTAHVDIVYEAQVSLAQPDFTAQCINARSAGAQTLMIVMDGGSLTRIARDCGRQSYHPDLWTGASILADDQKDDPDLDGVRAIAQTFPFMLDTTPAEQAYHAAMQRYAPSEPPAGTASMAWTAAELLRAAVAATGSRATSGPITTKLVLDGLYGLRAATLGGLAPGTLSFAPRSSGNPGSRCFWIIGLSRGAWVAPNGNTQVCAPPGVR